MSTKSLVTVFALIVMVLGLGIRAEAKGAVQITGLVNINTASAEELTLLPGIGPAKAAAIVDFRTAEKFQKAEDLVKVKGIGEKLYESLKAYITVDGPTTAKLDKNLAAE